MRTLFAMATYIFNRLIMGKVEIRNFYCPIEDNRILFLHIRGLSQKVVDFLYNKKTIRSIATKFCMRILPLFLHYHANFEEKMSNNKV